MSLQGVIDALKEYSTVRNTSANDEILSHCEKEFENGLEMLWKKLPSQTRNRIKKSQPVRQRSAKTRPKIVISAERSQIFTEWSTKPALFFKEQLPEEENLDDTQDRGGRQRCAISRAYQMITEVSSRTSRDELRTKLYQVLFYHLKVKFGAQHLRGNTILAMANIIHGDINVRPKEIADKITELANIGRRYDELCLAIASQRPSQDDYTYLGPIFYLPSDVTERSLKDASKRPGKIQSLRDRGILEVEQKDKIDALVHRLYSDIWSQAQANMEANSLVFKQDWQKSHRNPTFVLKGTSRKESEVESFANVISSTTSQEGLPPSSLSESEQDDHLNPGQHGHDGYRYFNPESHGQYDYRNFDPDQNRQNGYLSFDPDQNSQNGYLSFDPDQNSQNGYIAFDPDQNSQYGYVSFDPDQNSQNGYLSFDPDQYGQFMDTLGGMDSYPVQQIDVSRVLPDQIVNMTSSAIVPPQTQNLRSFYTADHFVPLGRSIPSISTNNQHGPNSSVIHRGSSNTINARRYPVDDMWHRYRSHNHSEASHMIVAEMQRGLSHQYSEVVI